MPTMSLFRQLRSFWILAAGDLLSIFGTALTQFAIDIWVYERSRSVTLYASVHLLGALPGVFLSPFAGAWVDRWNRRTVMIVCTAGEAAITLMLAGLAATNRLSTGVLFLASPLFASLGTFMALAVSAATAQLVPAGQMARIRGILGTVESFGFIAIPLLAGFLVTRMGIDGVLLLDAATTLVALGVTWSIALPDPARNHEESGAPSILHEARAGFAFVRDRPGLAHMLIFAVATELVARSATLLATPLVLATSSAEALGIVRGASMVGVLCGSMLLGVYGGRVKEKVRAMLIAWAFYAVCIVVVGFRVGVVGLAVFVFGCGMFEPVAGALSTALWQSKVPNSMIGRVFSLRQTTVSSVFVVVLLVMGPLSDGIFEPGMRSGGSFAKVFGPWLGIGPGRGIGLLLVMLGLFLLTAVALAMRSRRLRRVESELPDAAGASAPVS